ncbi:MAG: AmmeMemoRadiSam system protein B [Chloroflexi bacterium]|nr:AmmeMemoRadiSam system protein B [Chloroflexota bacterium]
MSSQNPNRVRHSVIAGSWYPGNERALRQTIERYIQAVPPTKLEGDLIGLIAPHAGYMYSGQVAAYAYKALENLHFERVVIISPMHRLYAGPFVTTDQDYYETPLGLVKVDREMVTLIDQAIGVRRVGEDDEHSLEIQLPFLQYMLGDFMLTPLMMGEQDYEHCRVLGDAVGKIFTAKNTLLVASTDLSHFHNYDTAVRMDKIVLDQIAKYDPEGLAKVLAMGQAEACGGGPVIAVMIAARHLGANHAQILKYANSGDVTGDRSGVVGYGAGVLYRMLAS